MSFKPTEEQELAVEMFLSQRDTVVEAGAGTGKTFTLKLMAEAAPNLRGQYTAFNKAIVVDSGSKFPSSVKCNTAHSLAWRGIGKNYADRLGSSGRMKSYEIARRLGIEDIEIVVAEQARKIPGPFMAGHIMQAVTNFCQSADLEQSVRHFSYIPGIDEHTEDGKRGYINNNIVQEYMLDYFIKAWKDLLLVDGQGGQLPFKHEHYLKFWQLNGPVIDADYILFDEAQDASPVMLSIVMQQKNAQKILVGDSQQSIYQWIGAVNALQNTGIQNKVFLSQCQPTGTMVRVPVEMPARGNGCGAPFIEYKEVPIEDISIGDSVVSWGKKGIVKRGDVVTDVVVRDYNGDIIVAKVGDKISRYTPNHECVVVLGEKLHEGNHVVYMMKRGIYYRVGRCPWQYGNGNAPIRRAVRENAEAMWILSVHKTESEAALAEALTQVEFGIPGAGWMQDEHYKMSLNDFWSVVGDNSKRAESCLLKHDLLIDYPLWTNKSKRPGAGWTTQVITAAANIRSGMKMMVPEKLGESNGSEQGFIPWSAWTETVVDRECYCGKIYSLSVDVNHTYVADGIVTHNSFRFGPAIAEMANKVLTVLNAELRLRGLESIDSRLDYIDRPDCYLTRTNATAVRRLLVELAQGQRPHLMGGGKDVMSFAEGAQKLKTGMSSEHPDLACFASWTEVQEYVNHDPQGDELRLLVKLVDDFGPYEIVQAIRGMSSEDRASIIISTAHKAKGREWHSVELGDDFPTPKEGEGLPGAEELRLLYVAITRASHVLDISKCKLAQVIADRTDETDEMSDETGFVDDPITIISKSERDYDPSAMVFQQMRFELQ